MEIKKEWWKSKTFWLNVFFLVVAVAHLVSSGLLLSMDQVGSIVLGVSAATNLYLRFVTKQPLSLPKLPFKQ